MRSILVILVMLAVAGCVGDPNGTPAAAEPAEGVAMECEPGSPCGDPAPAATPTAEAAPTAQESPPGPEDGAPEEGADGEATPGQAGSGCEGGINVGSCEPADEGNKTPPS